MFEGGLTLYLPQCFLRAEISCQVILRLTVSSPPAAGRLGMWVVTPLSCMIGVGCDTLRPFVRIYNGDVGAFRHWKHGLTPFDHRGIFEHYFLSQA